jgi:hypothetical protein
MSVRTDAGDHATKRVFANLRIDQQWSLGFDRGFAWWPHHLRQRVWSTGGVDDDGVRIHRVFAVTDFIKNVQAPSAKIESMLGGMGAFSVGAALVYDPQQRTIKLWSSATVHAENAGWMVDLFTSYSILQAIEAEAHAPFIAEMTSGEVDATAHPSSGPREHPDEMLSVRDLVFRPKGLSPSPWDGNDELIQLRDMLNQGNCLSMGDRNGLTAEFSFGSGTSMLRVITDEKNPTIGSGVGLFLHIPIWSNESEASAMSGALNRAEANANAISHLLGSWCARKIGTRWLPAFASFVPTLLYKPLLLTNLTFSMVQRAQWVAQFLYPELPPGAVIEAVAKRLEALSQGQEPDGRIS